MTPRFEHINGKLCLILEKPIPLTKDAKFPCIVRLIQDDSLIGIHTSEYAEMRGKEIEIIGLTQYGKIISDAKIFSNSTWPGSWFEILGYPVEEGSKEWALYQMQRGLAVSIFDQPNRFIRLIGDRIQDSGNHGFWNWKTCVDFMSYAAKTGWQLYEPEPKPCLICNGTGFVSYDDMDGITTQSCSCHHISEQPKQPFANVKKGDFVKHLDGRQLRIVEIKEPACLTSPHVKDRNKKFKCDNGNAYSVVDGSCVHNDDTITRILKPSEVVIQIGCLRGVVRPLSTNSIHLWFHLVNNKDEVSATIRLTELDPQTRELVEGLLKAQEEE